MTTPVIILIRPQLAENIGAVARVMSNFGFSSLRIVAPRPNLNTDVMAALAANGRYILQNMVHYTTLNEAVTDLNHLFATAANARNMHKEVLTPRDAIEDIRHISGKIGIMFGSERIGLTNQELQIAESVISIPVSENNPSLNLAQAVAVICYEWQTAKKLIHQQKTIQATKGELNFFIETLLSHLYKKNFFRNEHMRPEMEKNIVNMFAKAKLSSQEIRTLHGIIKNLLY